MTTGRVTTTLLGAATVVWLLAGCGTGDDTAATGPSSSSDSPTSPSSVSSTPTIGSPTTDSVDDPADDVPPFPHRTARQTAKGSRGGDLVLTDVRVAEHQGFDRIVLEFTGSSRPGWAVEYVDQAVLDGSGKHVPLDGDAFLNISASGTTWPAPGYYDGPARFEPESGGDVRDVHVGGTFEGYTQVIVGIAGDRVPFRTFALTGPSRLVVDVVDR